MEIGCYIPEFVLRSEELNPQQKIIYGRVLALIGKKEYCRARDCRFTEALGCDQETVAKLLRGLYNSGWLSREIKNNEDEDKDTEIRLYPLIFPKKGD